MTYRSCSSNLHIIDNNANFYIFDWLRFLTSLIMYSAHVQGAPDTIASESFAAPDVTSESSLTCGGGSSRCACHHII